ncbi:ABC transporter substrate-binding protein [Desulfogranum japonicum]|uniref:ABC transporter substrate-binding protein n=1 Tax=Desulfogranum japonicum TaxID=231447 RepID=UPI0003F682E3|nr:ABC transporter substrate-binding protein [Desulfogranum japonicum]
MKNNHWLLFLTFFCFTGITLLICGCAQNSGLSPSKIEESARQDTLKVGITPTDPPLVFRDHGKAIGLEVAFAKGLAQYTGKKLSLVELKWTEQIPALLDGKIDIIMSGMTITEARKYQINFCEPYMVTSQISLVRREDYNRFSEGFPALLNPVMKVGTVKGTTGDYLIEQNRARGNRIQFNSANKAVLALLDESIDVLVYDLPTNLYYGAQYSDKGLKPVIVPLTREYTAWAVHPGNTEILNKANAYLQSMKDENTLVPMIEKWIPFYKNLL